MNQFDQYFEAQINEDYLKCLLANNELAIPLDKKKQFTEDFRTLLKVQDIKKNYMFIGFFIGLLISLYFLYAIFKYKKNQSFFFYFFMIGVAIFIAFTMGYIGSKINRGNKQVSGQTLVDYVFEKLTFWTYSALRMTKGLNEKRFLIENLMNAFFDYVQYKQSNLWNVSLNNGYIKKIFQNNKNENSIFLSIKIFLIIFLDPNDKLNENGAIILSKIYQPILYLSQSQKLCQLINAIQQKFLNDTNLNAFDYQFVECYKKQEIKVDIDQKYFDDYVVFYMFPEFWNLLFEKCVDNDKPSISKEKSIQNLLQKFKFEKKDSLNFQDTDVNEVKSETHSQSNTYKRLLSYSNAERVNFGQQSERFFAQDFLRQSTKQDSIISSQQFIICRTKESLSQNFESINQLILKYKDDSQDYQCLCSNELDFVKKKVNDQGSQFTFKSQFFLEYEPELVYQLIYDINLRSKWDKVFSQFKVLKIIDKKTDILYSYMKAPFFIDDREWVQKRYTLKNYKGYTHIICFANYESDEYVQNKTAIRAKTNIAGYLLEKTNENYTILYGLTQTDIKGKIQKKP